MCIQHEGLVFYIERKGWGWGMSTEHDHCERVIELTTRVKNIEGWQKRQNGSLQDMNTKIDGIKSGLIGLMGGMIVSLVLLLINLGLGR